MNKPSLYPRTSKRIVVIGGGSGSFVILGGLKKYAKNITALVNMADDGGSTGQLRDELGALPPGDVRQCLVALSNSPKLRDLFTYRFEEGHFQGHALGNLFLTALEKMTGSFAEAVEVASDVLAITGRVEPVTLNDVALCMRTPGGEVTRGQFVIGEADFGSCRPDLWLEPEATLNPAAKTAIAEADLIVIAPGRLYGSIAPALIVSGMREALMSAKAKKVYICNLVTKTGQTDGFKVHDMADEIERIVGAEFLDTVLYNGHLPSKELVDKYARAGEYAVEIDQDALLGKHYHVQTANLLSGEIWQGAAAQDAIAKTRAFIRHDPDRTARYLLEMKQEDDT